MSHQHGPVRVQMHQSPSLIHKLGREGDAKLGGHETQTSFHVRILLIELLDPPPPLCHVQLSVQPIPHPGHVPPPAVLFPDPHPERQAFPHTVHVASPQFVAAHPARHGQVIHHVLAHGNALRTSEPPEGRVRRLGSLARHTHRAEVRPAVASVHVEEGAVHDRTAQVESGPAVAVQLHIQRLQLYAVAILTCRYGGRGPVIGEEGVTPPCNGHVHVSIESEADGPIGNDRRYRGGGGSKDGSGLLATKATSHPLHPDHHPTGLHACGRRAVHLSLGRRLRGAVHG
mmetsp:Transcript_41468/g.125581  ORF Transcript_41468/g.125581 Transcript_41468/m.125581 type:complete len:286 (+) Transcript_41468:353-1210(+)